MKKIVKTLFILFYVALVSISCQGSLPGADAWKKGVLTVSFDLSSSKDARVINDDFSQVVSGKVFLKQGGAIKKQANLTIDVGAKTGTGTFTDIIVGDYTLLLELYDAAPKLLYDAVSTVTINAGDNGVKSMELSKYIGTLSIAGSWTETISDLVTAIAELQQSGITIYAIPLILDINGKTVIGGIQNVYPGTYDLYVAIKGTGGVLKFDVTKTISILRGVNSEVIGGIHPRTGSIVINITGDATAPTITSGPSYTINGTTVTITWTTDEPSTSAVCYSTTSGFDYRSSLNWAPLGGDLTADNTSHTVAIAGLTVGAKYYYVVVSTDITGNLKASDEETMVISEIPQVGLIGEWLFNGNANDTSGNSNNGVVNGATLTVDRFGNSNNSYNFDGTDFIQIDHSENLNQSIGSFTAWIKPNNITFGYIMIKNIYGNPADMYSIGLNNGYIIVRPSINGSHITVSSNNIIATGTWIYVAGVYDGLKLSIYLNGVLENFNTVSGVFSQNTYPLYFGCDYNNAGAYYTGVMDDIRFYNRALSDSEILALYHEGGW